MPVSKELRKLIGENKLKKQRPTGTKWNAGKRWDRIQSVKRNLERLHGENEVQYAVFLTYPNPKGDPSRYLFTGGDEIKKLVQDHISFSEAFLEIKPKWTNPSTFVSTERSGSKRKRLHSHDDAESDQSGENDLPASPGEETSILSTSKEDTVLAADLQINPSIIVNTSVQEESALLQNEENDQSQNPSEPEKTDMSEEKQFLKDLKQGLYVEKQKKYRQGKCNATKQLLPKVKRKQPLAHSGVIQKTSSKETKRQKSQEDLDVEGTAINGNSREESQIVVLCFNLGEDGSIHLEENDYDDLT